MINNLETCSKSCINDYCGRHRAKLRLGAAGPMPCQSCGVGTRSVSKLCMSCGADRVQHANKYKEKKARLYFSNEVLVQLINKTMHQHFSNKVLVQLIDTTPHSQ